MKELDLRACTQSSVAIPFDPSTALTQPISSEIEPFCRGSWSLWTCPSRGGDSRYNDYGVRWSGVDRRSSPIKLQLDVWSSTGVLLARNDLLADHHSVFPVQFPAQPTGQREFLFSDVLPGTILRLEGVVQGSFEKRERGSASSPCTAMHAWEGAFLDSQHPNDVRFLFKNDRSLWSNAELLKSKSPYFKDLLSSDFSEGKRITEAEMRQGGPLRSSGSNLFPDSDDEGEGGDNARESESGKSKITCEASFHSINIADSAYTTYRAVLFYLLTGLISFAPLRSSLDAQAKSFSKMHPREPSSSSSSSSSSTRHLVAPSSPKSVYRLAEFLGLADLRLLALQALRTSLTPDNILTELFSDVSIAYPEVAVVMLDAAADMWEKVKGGEVVKEMERKLEDGTIELPVALVWKLTKVLKGR